MTTNNFMVTWYYRMERQTLYVAMEQDAKELARSLASSSCACNVRTGKSDVLETEIEFEEFIAAHNMNSKEFQEMASQRWPGAKCRINAANEFIWQYLMSYNGHTYSSWG